MSSRGWAYILEEYGLAKGDFDRAQMVINSCRKGGLLPLNICAEDGAREFDNLDRWIDRGTPEDEARYIVDSISTRHLHYTPFSFWEQQDVYVQMLVEKVDLKSLFGPICAHFHIPIANARGWSDMNSRGAMMRRFAEWEAKGHRCVLLYCGDFDPVGLEISDFLRSNMRELTDAVEWSPANLTIDRFGLNYDFIEANNLTWIEGLETGSGRDLGDPRHAFNGRASVQDYIARYGKRKVEANALVTRPAAGRELCRQAILRYLPEDAPDQYQAALTPPREQVRLEVVRLLSEGGAS